MQEEDLVHVASKQSIGQCNNDVYDCTIKNTRAA